MPPGPPGIPFLGNALQVQKSEAFRQFAEWGTTYGKACFFFTSRCLLIRPSVIGPIISLDMAGQPVVVVNSLKIANDLFGTSWRTIDAPRLTDCSNVCIYKIDAPLYTAIDHA